MTDAIHEQLSAFLDGELSAAESELLLKRVERDAELSARLKRHMLVGEALRSTQAEGPSRAFASRVANAIEAESLPGRARWVANQWLKPVAGGAIAAGVAAMVLVSLQQGSNPSALPDAQLVDAPEITESVESPNLDAVGEMPVDLAVAANEPTPAGVDRYVVPMPDGTRVAPPIQVIQQGQLANYVVAHSEYSTLLGPRNVLTGLLTKETEDRLAAEPEAVDAIKQATTHQADVGHGAPQPPTP